MTIDKPHLHNHTIAAIRLESYEDSAPGHYADNYCMLIDTLIQGTDVIHHSWVADICTDLTDAWNCNLLSGPNTDRATESLMQLVAEHNALLGISEDGCEELFQDEDED